VSHLALVIPVYNEAENLAAFAAEWFPALEALNTPYTVWFIDDGSTDASAAMLEKLHHAHPQCVRLLRQQNAGHGAACRRGYEQALAEGAAWVLQVDSDGQCDAAYLPEFWHRRSGADCVFGSRRVRGDGWLRTVISRLCSLLVGLRCGLRVGDANVPYRLMSAAVLRPALDRIPGDFGLQNIALTVMLRRGPAKWSFVPILFRPRAGGTNSINLRRIAAMGWRMLGELGRLPA
jgi:glycosyltransferase involved in cell wall biosynthesis